MELVEVNSQDKNLMNKLVEFGEKVATNVDFIQESETDTNSINISKYLLNMKEDAIIDLCYVKGTKDNKFVTLNFMSINDNISKPFIRKCTEYCLDNLGIETISIFSNDLSKKNLEDIGYLSLGQYKGINAYVKDREESQELGTIKR